MLNRLDFNEVLANKVNTLKLLADQAFENTNEDTVEIPFWVPTMLHKHVIFDDFKKTIRKVLEEDHNYIMSDFTDRVEEVYKGINRFVKITKK